MLRMRRYRVFLAFAVIALFAFYKFGNSGAASWRQSAGLSDAPKAHEDTKGNAAKNTKPAAALTLPPKPQIAHETKEFEVDIPEASSSRAIIKPPAVSSIPKPVDPSPPTPAVTKKPASGIGGHENDKALPPPSDDFFEQGQGRLEVPTLPSSVPPIHWKKQSEHFPVPSASTIELPKASPKSIPKIQFAFKEESPSAKADRETKLNQIKEVFKRSWDGYKQNAWLQDELSPVSGKFRNPFASWGATLVDALDTLWMMDLKEEFEEAVAAVDKIDFTTSPRADIPLFETTIRYLGGLVAAYDLSGMKHKNLLEKAVELAEVLISAFDTPNRMPQTYYYWRPSFASQPHRASNRVVLAEIGSLSVEFTRLAQLTGEPKYYDAIARITDALEEFQDKTRLPGMWPTYLDASGCKKIDYHSPADIPLQSPLDDEDEVNIPLSPKTLDDDERPVSPPKESLASTSSIPPTAEEKKPKMIPLEKPDPIIFNRVEAAAQPAQPAKGKIENWQDDTEISDLYKQAGWKQPTKAKRQSNNAEWIDDETRPKPAAAKSAPSPTPSLPFGHECEEQGFVSSSEYGQEEYTLGGMSDSTYEYLPKQWLLLGGVVDKYRTMYESSADVVKQNLIFRPMLPNEDDILFSGKLNVPSPLDDPGSKASLEPENAHLTCFAGGMFAMGAKIFDRKDDLEIAKKLTEGCVWSYNSTSTGIMPESFLSVPCESRKSCEWNETKYWEVLDSGADARLASYKSQMETYDRQMSSASAEYADAMASYTAAPTPAGGLAAIYETSATPTAEAGSVQGLQKRQLDIGNTEPLGKAAFKLNPITGDEEEVPSRVSDVVGSEVSPEAATKTKPVFPVIYSPKPPLTHEEYVKNRLQEERLPIGMTQIRAKNYILRPEAIESVWYLYRITGDNHWREVGWDMFRAVNDHTSTLYGNSAIDDVTKTSPELLDEMESFWLAETLKYFYLLFADESLVSLDDWVLNTEAHPFKRPS